MLPVKVKVEKPGLGGVYSALPPSRSSCISAPTPCCADLETANARSRLDAVLQGLLERSDGEREQMDEDPGKPPSDPLGKDSSPTAAGKRPSARFSHHRRKKRKETDDGLTEGGQQRQNTYVIKLFDRSVDLAQFPEAAPLYPVCRAWMRNSPGLRDRDPEHSPSPGPGSGLPPLPEDDEGPEGPPGHGADVYKLPPPFPLPEGAPGLPTRSRVPSPLGPDITASRPDAPPDPVLSTSALIYKNMERWKKIRQRWKEASHRNQLRYAESMKILKEMYERQ